MTERFVKDSLLNLSSNGLVKVYRGFDSSNSSLPIALKFQLHPTLSHANLTLREALNQASLAHPNVCQVIDCSVKEWPSGQVETVLALELMEKGDLMKEIERRMMRGEKWPQTELLEILEKILLALVFAQKNGICHRDIKPQNIFLHKESGIKVGDFGSSTSLADTDMAASFSLQGSPFYLSPELKSHYIQYLTNGEAEVKHDPYKSDVYSLGVMMLYMARLRSPVEFANLVRLREKTEELVEECREYPVLQRLMRDMLEVEPERRIGLGRLLELLRTSKRLGHVHIDENTRLCAICNHPIFKACSSTDRREPSDFTCSLSCEKRLDAAGLYKCLGCNSPSHATSTIVLPCGHFYHNIVCLYQALSEASQGFFIPADYNCSNCKTHIPDETLEEAFSEASLEDLRRLGEVKMCSLCQKLPGVLVLQCKHARCPKCAGRIWKPCPCSNKPAACVLS
jgi:serine/threonine protein kinase